MAIVEKIRALPVRTLTELNEVHDFYSHTKMAWLFFLDGTQAGNAFALRNSATGTEMTDAELAARAPLYISKDLAQATFQQYLSIFEHFFFDLLRVRLMAFPEGLARRELRLEQVLEVPDKEAIVLQVVNKELNEVASKRPSEWFAYLEKLVRLGCPTIDEIERISEAKATRDLLAHNRGLVNKVYAAKAGPAARHQIGEQLDIPEAYHRETWELLRKVIVDVCTAAEARFA